MNLIQQKGGEKAMGQLSMNELATEVHARIDDVEGMPKLKRHGVYEILQAMFDVAAKAIAAGEDVSIPHFGKFKLRLQNARTGRNPSSGEKLDIPEKSVVKFQPSTHLRESAAEALSIVKKDAKAKAAVVKKRKNSKKKKK